MALPGDVTTFSLTFGHSTNGYTDANGAVAMVGERVELWPIDLATGKRLVVTHIASGQVIVPTDVTVTIDAEGKATVGPLPHTDNPTLSPIGFGYRVEWQVQSGSRRTAPKDKTFAVPTAAGASVDFDLLDVAEAVPGVLVPMGVSAGVADAAVSALIPGPSLTATALRAAFVSSSRLVRAPAGAVTVWGHSYAFGIGASDRAKGLGYVAAYSLGLTERNEAVSGSSLTSAPAGASYVKTLQQVKPSALGVVTGSGTTATNSRGFTTTGGVHLAMYGINDVNELGGLSDQLTAFRDTLRAVVSRWRAGAVFEDTNSSFTFTGTWPTHTIADRNSGAGYRYTATAAGTYSIAVPADFPGGAIGIGLWSGSPLGGGATHTATVNGQTYVIDAHQRRTGGTGHPHLLRIPDLPAGAQTITAALSDVVTLTGVDYWQWEAPDDEAPLVILLKQPYAPDYTAYGAGGTFGPPTDARVDDLNAIIDEVAAEFGDRVITVDLSPLNKATTLFTVDKIHPNDRGYRVIGELTAAAVRAAGFTIVATSRDEPYRTYGAAVPTGTRQGWYVGDEVVNSAPAVLGTAGSQYTIHSWVCTVEGRPGTWVERRMLTGT